MIVKKAAATNINFILIMAALFIVPLSLRAYPWSMYTAAIPSSFALFQFSASALHCALRNLLPFHLFSPFVLLSLFRLSPPSRLVCLSATITLFFPSLLPGLSIPGQISWLARWQLQPSSAIFHPFRNTLDKNYHWTIFVAQLALCTGPFSLAYCRTHAGDLTE